MLDAAVRTWEAGDERSWSGVGIVHVLTPWTAHDPEPPACWRLPELRLKFRPPKGFPWLQAHGPQIQQEGGSKSRASDHIMTLSEEPSLGPPGKTQAAPLNEDFRETMNHFFGKYVPNIAWGNTYTKKDPLFI